MEKDFHDIDALAKFIFIDNKDNHTIDLIIEEGCSSTKELFFICVELLTKGLKLLYADTDDKVDLKNITMDQLKYIKSKLLLVKIDFEINMIENKNFIIEINNKGTASEEYNEENINDSSLTEEEKYNLKILKQLITSVDELDDNLPLNEYCFKIELDDSIYMVNFSLHRHS
jgi:hypothetical protein